jgi:hypothetical protein
MSEETNPLGLDAAAFVPQEATDAFERAEIVVSCVLGPGKGADRRCSLIVSTEPPTDIPHRNLSLLPHSAACTLAEMPQVVAGLVNEEQSAFGEAWVKAWTEQQKMKSKAKAKPRAAAASPAKVAITKAPLLDDEPEATEAGDEDEAQPEEEIDEPEDQADDEEPEEVEVPQQAVPTKPPAKASAAPAPTKAAPLPEAAPASAQMSLLGGIDL